MTVPAAYQRWYRLRYQLRDQLRFTARRTRIAGLRLGGAGLRGFAVFDISIRTGSLL
jgi:hypothetical protein